MNLRIDLSEQSDTVQVVSSWNICLPYDRITEEKFEDTIFEDPNYEKQGNLVAFKNGKLIGFVAAVVREGITGRDGAGRLHEEHFGICGCSIDYLVCIQMAYAEIMNLTSEFLDFASPLLWLSP